MKKKTRIEDSERKTQDMSAVAEYDGSSSNSAKYVEATGNDYVETETPPVGIDGKMANFWYHYKWHTIIGLCVLVFIYIGVSQLMNNNPADVTAMYAGPAALNTAEFNNALTEMLSEDYNGNGKKHAYLHDIQLYSDGQLAELVEQLKEAGAEYPYYDRTVNAQAYQDFQSYIFLGEYGVLFLDPALFEQVKESNALVRLDEVFEEIPDSAIDDYGIRLYDTKFCNYYSVFKSMPSDTVLCLRAATAPNGLFSSKKQADKNFDRNKAFFIDLMSFEYPEGFEG